MKLLLSPGLASMCRCPEEIEFESVTRGSELLNQARNAYPGVRSMLPEGGSTPRYILMFIDGDQVHESELEHEVSTTSVLRILSAVAGG